MSNTLIKITASCRRNEMIAYKSYEDAQQTIKHAEDLRRKTYKLYIEASAKSRDCFDALNEEDKEVYDQFFDDEGNIKE